MLLLAPLVCLPRSAWSKLGSSQQTQQEEEDEEGGDKIEVKQLLCQHSPRRRVPALPRIASEQPVAPPQPPHFPSRCPPPPQAVTLRLLR